VVAGRRLPEIGESGEEQQEERHPLPVL